MHGGVGAGGPSPPWPHTALGGLWSRRAVLGEGSRPSRAPHLRCLSRAGAEPPGGSVGAVRALSAQLLGLAGDPARDPDPAVYLALRLARDHDPRLEQRYLERLQDTFQQSYGRWVPRGPPTGLWGHLCPPC